VPEIKVKRKIISYYKKMILNKIVSFVHMHTIQKRQLVY